MKSFNNFLNEKNGLWANIHAKRKRGEKPNPPGHPDRPTAQDFKDAQKTSKKENYVSDAQRKAVWASRNDEKKKKNEAVEEKTLTPAEKKKREEIAKAMERENPGMDMKKKMAIATWQAKKVAEAYEDDEPASPDEASMAMRQLGFIEYAAEEVMDHIKSGKEFPEWMQNKLSKLHGQMESLHSALGDHGGDDEEDDMKEATKVDEISLSHLSNTIAKSTGTKNIKTAMKPGEVKKGLDDLRKRLGTLGKEPQKESVQSADKKPEKFVKPDGTVGIRMVRVDKKVIDKDA